MEKFEKLKAKLDVFTGYLSADAEIRYFDSGKCKTTFAIPLKDGDNTIWLNAECWNKIAEKASVYKKGDEVIVFGNLKEVEYETKDKEKKTKIIFAVKGII